MFLMRFTERAYYHYTTEGILSSHFVYDSTTIAFDTPPPIP